MSQLEGVRTLKPSNVVGLGQRSFRSEQVGDVEYSLLDEKAAALFQALREDDLAAFAAAFPGWVTQIPR